MPEEHYSSPEISEEEELARVDREFLEKINSLKKRRAFIDFVKKNSLTVTSSLYLIALGVFLSFGKGEGTGVVNNHNYDEKRLILDDKLPIIRRVQGVLSEKIKNYTERRIFLNNNLDHILNNAESVEDVETIINELLVKEPKI